jgi:hypothetical protein
VKSILADAAAFYVNVHTAEFPAGAIRGQLTGTSTAAFGWISAVTLKGSTEPDATGTAVVRIRKDVNMVCFRLHAEKITLPATAAHIHMGAMGKAGNVLIPLCGPCRSGAHGKATFTRAMKRALAHHKLYVNVHTAKNPNGEIRGQLAKM